MSAAETASTALRIAVRLLVALAALVFMFWLYQKIDANFQRQALIEEQEFGALREELEEDFTGDEIAGIDGPVLVYGYSKKQELDQLRYDQASDLTLAIGKNGVQRRVADDDRRVIWFKTIEREVDVPAGEDDDTGRPGKEMRAYAYVARLATRQMYLDGKSDLVVGSLSSLDQREIAQGVPFLDTVTQAEGENEVALLFWTGSDTARHVVIDVSSMEMTQSRDVDLPDKDSFTLDREDEDEVQNLEAVMERAVNAADGRPRPGRR